MQATPIVIDFDVIEHLCLGHIARDETFTVDGFDLEAVVPGLHGGVVVAVAFFAHAT